MTEFKKTKGQTQIVKNVVESKASNFCIYGGSRSGKSAIIFYMLVVRACKCKSDHVIARSTFSSAKASIWQQTIPQIMSLAFPNLQFKKNHTDHIIYFPNGSTIKIVGLDDKDKLEKLLGQEMSSFWLNESNQIPYGAFSKLKTRLAQKNILKKVAFLDENPTLKTSWVFQLFQQGIDPQDGEAIGNREDYATWQLNVYSNLHNLDEDYLKMLKKLPEAERKRFLLGVYSDDNLGAVAYAFNDDHVTEEAERQVGTDYIGSDFNYWYNASILASRTDNYLYVWDESIIEGDTYKKCHALKEKHVAGAFVVADSTGKGMRTSAKGGMSDHKIMKQFGFQMIQQTNPYVKDRIANLNRCFSMSIIKIHPRCKKLIRDLKQCSWDKNGDIDQKTDPSLSHLLDSLSYLTWKLFPLMGNRKSTSKQF